MKPLRVPAPRRTNGAAPEHQPADERLIDILVVGLALSADRMQHYGLLTSQVHSIVRLDASDRRFRRIDDGRGELDYEGASIPVCPLREALGLGAPPPAGAQVLHVLTVRLDPALGGPARYFGLLVDDVVEIAGYPLAAIRPFPGWLVRALPPQAIWGAIPREGGAILLLLDGLTLAGPCREHYG